MTSPATEKELRDPQYLAKLAKWLVTEQPITLAINGDSAASGYPMALQLFEQVCWSLARSLALSLALSLCARAEIACSPAPCEHAMRVLALAHTRAYHHPRVLLATRHRKSSIPSAPPEPPR